MHLPAHEIAALIPDHASRVAWIAAGMPCELEEVVTLCLRTRRERAITASKTPQVKASRVRSRISAERL
jgi:hypothetical protein